MAVDRWYGSGKPRSAANSRARQRVAKGQFTKGKKGIGATIKSQRAKQAASPLGQLADTVLGFALPVGKVKAAAMGLQAAGKTAAASALRARVLAKESGRNLPKTIALAEKMWTRTPGSSAPTPQTVGKTLLGKLPREASESVFPRAPKKGPMGQPDLGDLGAGRVGLPFNTPAQIRRANRARRATQAADRVYELEKRLNLPGTAPKRVR